MIIPAKFIKPINQINKSNQKLLSMLLNEMVVVMVMVMVMVMVTTLIAVKYIPVIKLE